MIKAIILYPLTAIILSGSCGTTKDSTGTDTAAGGTTPTVQEQNTGTATSEAEKEKIMKEEQQRIMQPCRILVSFISIGEGIDPKARESMDKVLAKWSEKGKLLEMETIPWGREGEVDYCFKLNELNKSDQETFVNDIKATFKGNSLVQLAENEGSRHKR